MIVLRICAIAQEAHDYMMVQMLPKANLRGVRITQATPDQIVSCVRSLVAGDRTAHTFVAVNVHTFTEARRSPQIREALNDATVAWVDGIPLRWMMNAAGIQAPPRIHGHDLALLVLERLSDARHLFFGSTDETLGMLRDSLSRQFPHLKTAGFISPPFRKQAQAETAEMLDRLNGSGADILWVALGAPKQELWALLNRTSVRIPVVLCVGAAFEILAGRFTRAPKLVQRLGLEWAWRLLQDPWRLWRRYFATNCSFLVSLAVEAVRRLFAAPRPQKGI
jgi:N-acetylglucosaminyldiphosphoundecaprenol N-acetyl-beta-D-mannosaminyltransferase